MVACSVSLAPSHTVQNTSRMVCAKRAMYGCPIVCMRLSIAISTFNPDSVEHCTG